LGLTTLRRDPENFIAELEQAALLPGSTITSPDLSDAIHHRRHGKDET
jgi:catalase